MQASGDFLYIDTPQALRDLSQRLAGVEWLALDTEFQREKTYFPQLCLLQVGTPSLAACIDPLALDDLSPLLEVLYDPRIVKVMHACRQDMEIFFHLRGTLPAPVFDTQVAAPLLGHPDQVGYGTLVQALLGVTLDKAHTRADWTRRPLPADQLRYAVDDVHYLCMLYEKLRDELGARGRLDWLAEDFAELSDPARYRTPEQAWRRIKGVERLRPAQLSVLQALATWREETARNEDRPRNWLLRDDALLDLARLMPQTREDLARIRGPHERIWNRHGDRIVQLIAQARERPAEPLPKYERVARLRPEQDALIDLLMSVVTLRGAQHAVSPSALASRKDLEQIVRGDGVPPVLHGWRKAMVGQDLLDVLAGKCSVVVIDGALELVPAPVV